MTGASFVHNHDGSKESPWWLAGDHHGSHIAHLVAQLDPCCSLYIAKVTESKARVDKERVTQVYINTSRTMNQINLCRQFDGPLKKRLTSSILAWYCILKIRTY